MRKLQGMEQWFGVSAHPKRKKSLQVEIAVTLTCISAICVLFLGSLFSKQALDGTTKSVMDKNEQLLLQAADAMESNVMEMIDISNHIYYGLLRNYDMEDPLVIENLAFYLDGTQLQSVGLFDMRGNCVFSDPYTPNKRRVSTKEQWFQSAVEQIDRANFSSPHLNSIYKNDNGVRQSVISLSRYVEINRNGQMVPYVLLLDFHANEVLSVAKPDAFGYYFMVDADGATLFHPRARLAQSGLYQEPAQEYTVKPDGSYTARIKGENYDISVQTIGYTGWRMVHVTSVTSYLSIRKPVFLYVIWAAILAFVGILIFINQFVARKITKPVRELEKAVDEFADGQLMPTEQIHGAYEIEHLGQKFGEMAQNIQLLMRDTLKQQEERRKTEIKLLQSQINPHFLYNTLDSIIWMIQSGKYEGAAKMVSALADFFRISLSSGKDIITVEKELSHTDSYLSIQHMRFQDTFTYEIELEDAVKNCLCPKLIVQPLVENAVYHGIEGNYDDGEIKIRAYGDGDCVRIDVEDNGAGMSKERVHEIMHEQVVSSRRGSGVGLRNIDQRLKMICGAAYGLTITSEEDEGTVVSIRIPKKFEDNEDKNISD